MSKYIKLEDAIERLNQLYHSYEVEEWLKHLPTIEVSEDCISKKFISDSLIHRIAELNKQGEKAIPIQTELIKFKKFVDNITQVIPRSDK